MKDPNLWPTHKGRARGKKARHRAEIRAQRTGKPYLRHRGGRTKPDAALEASIERMFRR